MRSKGRKMELDRFADGVRKAQSGLNEALLYSPGRLRGGELPGAEVVLRQMRDHLNLLTDSLFPPRFPPKKEGA